MSRVSVIDWVGAGLFVLTIFAVIGHGGLRFFAARRNGRHTAELEEAYMYGIYERLWHWLQTATIGLLLFSGLIIHRPEMFGMFSFAGVVIVHNVVAAILLINAALAAFYHFASGEIRQFLPHPHGLFDQLFRQGRFYMDGIFRREPHPFEKGPGRKMNPLQQITYLGLLNVLLPLQVITGALMWAAGQWPAFAARLGGLTLLAPIHSMVAWLFASFIVGHVYLTTTGATPLTSLRGMIMGWEDVEAPAAETSAAATD
jgi:thiosulfate reductase cytochrome b subunit